MYVSSLLLSSENMCGRRPFEWSTQWDLNSLLFPVYKNKSEFKSHWVLHSKGLVPHMFSDESNKLETYIYITHIKEQNK